MYGPLLNMYSENFGFGPESFYYRLKNDDLHATHLSCARQDLLILLLGRFELARSSRGVLKDPINTEQQSAVSGNWGFFLCGSPYNK